MRVLAARAPLSETQEPLVEAPLPNTNKPTLLSLVTEAFVVYVEGLLLDDEAKDELERRLAELVGRSPEDWRSTLYKIDIQLGRDPTRGLEGIYVEPPGVRRNDALAHESFRFRKPKVWSSIFEVAFKGARSKGATPEMAEDCAIEVCLDTARRDAGVHEDEELIKLAYRAGQWVACRRLRNDRRHAEQNKNQPSGGMSPEGGDLAQIVLDWLSTIGLIGNGRYRCLLLGTALGAARVVLIQWFQYPTTGAFNVALSRARAEWRRLRQDDSRSIKKVTPREIFSRLEPDLEILAKAAIKANGASAAIDPLDIFEASAESEPEHGPSLSPSTPTKGQ